MNRKVQRIGTSVGITIPRAMLQMAAISQGDAVEILLEATPSGNQLIVKKYRG